MSENILTQSYLKALFDYSPESGLLSWRSRPWSHDPAGHDWKWWNSRFAGRAAGGANNCGYLQVNINGERHLVHRVIWFLMTGSWPSDQIDHIDHRPRNNRFDNLREATGSQNQRNRKLNANNKSGVSGVHWHKASKKWQARIMADNKRICLGSFDDIEDAVCARKSAEVKFGYHRNHGNGAE